MKTHTSIRALATALVVLPTLAAPAFTQDAADAEFGDYIGTILLGESRRGVQTDIAASETVITQEEIEARQAGTVAELLNTVPNVSLLNGSTPQGGGVSIRGFGSQAGLYGTDGKVSVVVDGVASGAEEVYRNGSSLALEPELFRQVKVTRGPSNSFRYSSGAIGGTIELETKDASDFLTGDDTFSVRQKLGYESNGDGLLSTSIFAFAPADDLEFLLFLGKRDVDDREDGNGDTLSGTGFDQESYLVKGKYQVSDSTTLSFAHSHNEIPENDVFYNVFDPNIDSFFGTVDRDTEDETTYVELAYSAPDNDLINLTARLQRKYEAIEIDSIENPFATTLLEADHQTETLSFRLDNVAYFSTGTVAHTLTAGIELSDRERTSVADNGDNDTSAPGGTDRSIAVYIADEIAATSRLTLTPQLRFERQTLTGENNGSSTSVLDGFDYVSEAVTGALSAKYDITDSFSAFGTAAYNENLPILDDLSNDFIEQSEKGRTYEIGVSYDGSNVVAADDVLKAKLTYFQSDIWDGTTYSGIDGVEVKGFEFEVSYVHPEFYADFNVGTSRAEVTETGADFNYGIPDTAQLTLGKRFLDDQLDLSAEVSHTASFDRTSATSGALAPTEKYTLLDISVGYTPNRGALDGVELRASLENLTDRNYRSYGSSRNGEGRNLALSVAKTF
jgi:hemoglobin/transferrin/lactoferrin receptor protein